jgi:hypothetical protein
MPRIVPHLALLSIFLLCTATSAPAQEQREEHELRWWKGNLHTHTLWSDGDDFPEMVADWYRENDYNFLALSDHNVISQGQRWMLVPEIEKRAGKIGIEKYLERFGPHWVERRHNSEKGVEEIRLKPFTEYRALVEERGTFIMLQSEEITARFESLPIHLNAANILELIKPREGGSVVETIENNLQAVIEQSQRTGQEMLPHINHPNFRWAITAEDLAEVVSEHFFEVWNGHPGVNHLGDDLRPGLETMWDIANTIRLSKLNLPPLYGLGTDDSHHHHFEGMNRSIPGRGWVMVRAHHLTPESLIRALRAGDFYASSGVSLQDVRYDPETKQISIVIDAEEGATYTTRFVGTPLKYDDTTEDPPTVDAEGKPMRASRRYSADVGKTFATVEGTTPSYTLRGEEMYVRATITSSAGADRPAYEGQKKQAWTQPVGWELRPKNSK